MTVAHTPRRAGSYAGNGVNTQFPFAFKVFAKNDVQVVFTDVAKRETVLVMDSQYTVTLNNDQDNAPGGVVTYPVAGAPLAAGELLNILSVLPYEQPTDIQNQGGFYPQVIEDALDRGVIHVQQLAEGLSRAVKLPVSDPRTPEEFTEEFFQAAQDAKAAATEAAASESAAAASATTAAAAAQQAQDRWNDISTKFTVSTDPPSGGKDGDIWFQVI